MTLQGRVPVAHAVADGPAEGTLSETVGTESPGHVGESAAYLLARLQILEGRVRQLVAMRRKDDPSPDDPFRGLYISDDHVDHILSSSVSPRGPTWGDSDALRQLDERAADLEAVGTDIRLRSLARRAGLDHIDLDLLLVCLAPDLDSRFERLYGYLNDDVSRRRATIGLCLELAGASPWSAASRARLTADAPLMTSSLVVLDEGDRPFLSRTLRVPDRVAAHLLGDGRPDREVAHLLRSSPGTAGGRLDAMLGGLLREGLHLVYLREKPGSSAPAAAMEALAAAGMRALVMDLERIQRPDDVEPLARLVAREAMLIDAGVVAGPVEALLERGAGAVRAFADIRSPVVLHGRIGWEPGWSSEVPLVVDLPPASVAERTSDWRATIGPSAADIDSTDITSQFILSSEQVRRAVTSARLQASLDGVSGIEARHLRAGARAQNGAGLEKLARRIEPRVSWQDLVLAPTAEEALHELAGRARRRGRVLDEWGMRPGGGRGRGITVLFGGDSGTGKTMSAEVVAGDLGLDLYTVNLATVVDKYVGETEKNLERIFVEADGVNAVLLFDEADALFGKRSEVRDANDRYANIEVAYLLQRMETFDGLAILATNLRANVDEAFARRLDMVVDFPSPDEALRLRLWDKCLSPGVPRAGDIDLEFCARSFEVSGGNIRSITITAAYLAAEDDRAVTMTDLMKAVQREYRKLGRLIVPSEFGPYFSLVAV
ncbi:MAG TPA: ATP-binding protein [Acidimicrobiales bacterium]|nr:ATP-binding protein [Acidimicrobiales bacterium]